MSSSVCGSETTGTLLRIAQTTARTPTGRARVRARPAVLNPRCGKADAGLESIATISLIIGDGGAFKQVLHPSGIDGASPPRR
ncbi:hypothetical protein ACFXDH_29095 [Streptomyces sp. NPDC059467]|uniref:GntT/GntP/DsdX family permease n=1 Tax=Streptomyces sp. NPDC059467 TaxID=3346844 RepID=UPI003689B9C7